MGIFTLLGIDFETQGDQPKTTNITEVGAVLHEVGGAGRIQGLSQFCFEREYPPQTPKIVDITGITDAMLIENGKPRKEVLEQMLFPMMEKADLILAHKVAFDKVVLESTCEKFGITPPTKKWLCTLTDINWPSKYGCRKLSHLAYEHGIMVDPRTLHRAENDVDLMLKLFLTLDFDKTLEYAALPWVYLRAEIVGPWVDGGVQTGIAKSLGFSWETVKGTDTPKFPKWWLTRTKATQVDNIKEQAATCASPFRVTTIEGV